MNDTNDDLTENLQSTSRGPRVCIIRFKKFTMSGRTKEGLDDDRKKKKKTGNKKEEEQPFNRIHRRFEMRFNKKNSKYRKQSKSNRTIRKKFFQTQQIKVLITN